MQAPIRTFCLLLGCALAGSLHAADSSGARMEQEYLVHVWQTDDGLPENWVSSITQTPDGYLWIGTRYGGLARFDGRRFANYNPADIGAMRDVQVEFVDVDQTGALWSFMGNESITAFRDGQFHLYRTPRAEPRFRVDRCLENISNDVVFFAEEGRIARLHRTADTNSWELLSSSPPESAVHEGFFRDAAGVFWYATQDGNLGQFDGRQFSTFRGAGAPPPSKVTVVTAGRGGQIWAATASRVFRWNGSAFEDQTPAAGRPAGDIQEITVCPNGDLWVLDGDRLRKIHAGAWVADVSLGRMIQRDNTSHTSPLYSDADGNAWLIDYGHGLWYARSSDSAHGLTEADGLPSTFITCWFQDRENNIWVGSAGGGVARISKKVVHVLGQREDLPGKIVRSVCLDSRGTLWAGTMSGNLAYWDNQRFNQLLLPSNDQITPLESITVCPNYDGNLWIGSLRHGLMLFDGRKITRPVALGDATSVRTLFQDSRSNLWVGGLVGLSRFSNGQLRGFGTAEGFQSGIAIGAMTEDAQGVIWIVTGPGDLWNFRDGKFTRFPPPREWPSFRFSALKTDASGGVWIGTLGEGLLRFKDGQYFRFNDHQGLPNNYVSQLLTDRQGRLWLGTYGGIVRISLTNLDAVAEGRESQLVCRVYGRSSGLEALECSSGFEPSCWTSPNGRLWFSTASGLAFVDPDETDTLHPPPPVIIEEMQVDGVSQTIPGNGDSELLVKPGNHFLQFRFTGLSLAAPDEVRFRAQLEGTDGQWQDLNDQRTVDYGPLAPGHYRLHVQACNSEGLWNEQGAMLAFAVQPFFWQTWWFKSAAIVASFVLTGLVVTLIVRRRHRAELEKVKYQLEMNRERARIAQDLHDDLGTSLTQISMLSSLADRASSPEEGKSFSQQIRKQSRDMVVALDEIVWAVNPRNDSLVELINYLGNFAEEFFRPTTIRCRQEIPDHLPAHHLSSETRHHLFLVFKESINNVARHSNATRVWVTAELTPAEVRISVRDDGKGFDASAEGFRAGDGLLNMKTRMEQIGGRVDIQSSPGGGASVIIVLPLKSA